MNFDCQKCLDLRWVYLPNENGSGGVPCQSCNADKYYPPRTIGSGEFYPKRPKQLKEDITT